MSMIKKEDAEKRWCPWARVFHSHGAFNRNFNSKLPEGANCLTDKCMAWQSTMDANYGQCRLLHK